jgi:NAD+ kinase
MTLAFQSIAIIGKYMNQSALQLMRKDLLDLAEHLTAKNLQVWVEQETAQHANITAYKTAALNNIGSEVDLVIVMGGDGTMLSVARSLIDFNVPLVGINQGRFGFLTDLRVEDMLGQLDGILAGDYVLEPRVILSATVTRDGQEVHANYALNDVVVKSALRLIELEVSVDEKFVHKQRSDGLMISTPTGTTAYALSAGGPILHPNLQAISLVPICPHTLSNRPIAVHSDSKIDIRLLQLGHAQLSFDGQFQMELKQGDKVTVKRDSQSVSLLHPSDYCYFDMLRNKLNWG